MKDYLLTLKIQNNYLVKMMESMSIRNAAELSRLSGISQNCIGDALSLKKSAYTNNGSLRSAAEGLCAFFMCEVGDIYPPEHLHNPLDNNIFKAEYAYQENLLEEKGACPSLLIESDDAKGMVKDILSNLSPRRLKAVQMKHGLGNECESNFKEIGFEFGVSPERARQIYRSAAREIRRYMQKDDQRHYLKELNIN